MDSIKNLQAKTAMVGSQAAKLQPKKRTTVAESQLAANQNDSNSDS